jgi:hypothetical protein
VRDDLFDVSFRVHAKEITDYILRGNGRRIVPKAIYLAAWEIQYALNRTSGSVRGQADRPDEKGVAK